MKTYSLKLINKGSDEALMDNSKIVCEIVRPKKSKWGRTFNLTFTIKESGNIIPSWDIFPSDLHDAMPEIVEAMTYTKYADVKYSDVTYSTIKQGDIVTNNYIKIILDGKKLLPIEFKPDFTRKPNPLWYYSRVTNKTYETYIPTIDIDSYKFNTWKTIKNCLYFSKKVHVVDADGKIVVGADGKPKHTNVEGFIHVNTPNINGDLQNEIALYNYGFRDSLDEIMKYYKHNIYIPGFLSTKRIRQMINFIVIPLGKLFGERKLKQNQPVWRDEDLYRWEPEEVNVYISKDIAHLIPNNLRHSKYIKWILIDDSVYISPNQFSCDIITKKIELNKDAAKILKRKYNYITERDSEPDSRLRVDGNHLFLNGIMVNTPNDYVSQEVGVLNSYYTVNKPTSQWDVSAGSNWLLNECFRNKTLGDDVIPTSVKDRLTVILSNISDKDEPLEVNNQCGFLLIGAVAYIKELYRKLKVKTYNQDMYIALKEPTSGLPDAPASFDADLYDYDVVLVAEELKDAGITVVEKQLRCDNSICKAFAKRQQRQRRLLHIIIKK